MYWKISRFVHNFLQNFHMVLKVYALLRIYVDFWDTLDFFSFFLLKL